MKKKNKDVQEVEKKIDNIFTEYEINILLSNDTIDNFTVEYGKKKFTYIGKTYIINNKAMYLLPKKDGYMPVLYYKENCPKPIDIHNKNKGIPARALQLIWDSSIYSVIMTFDTDKINKLIIILLLINAGLFGLKLYLTYGR